MHFEELSKLPQDQIEGLKNKLILRPLESKEELQAWIYLFFDILFPIGTVDPGSTHGPVDAMWEIYNLMKTGQSAECPQVCMLSSRDSYKTLNAAALEVLCMMHFEVPVAHMAAIKAQSAKAIQYINGFFRKVKPYLEAHGWKKKSDSKTYIDWITPNGDTVWLNIVTATIAGANSEHVPMLFIDEVDVVQDPRALKEAKMIPSMWGKYFPLTIYLSTRKFAGGLMEKTLEETVKSGGRVLRWNIIDVTERITKEEAQVDKPKVIRYVSRELPMETIDEEAWEKLPNEVKIKYEKVEAYAGIADHPMLPVMRNYLVDRPQGDVGDLYKPLVAVYNNFRQIPPDMGEAQLLCNKPSSSGLVYPRFDPEKNVLSVKEALQKVMGESVEMDSYEYLKDYIKNLGIPIIGGADWGMTDMTSFVILAMLPGGEVWHMDTLAMSGLEIDDIAKYGKELQDDWGVTKWYADQNYPAYLSMLRRKAGWKCPKFTKVVLDGIAGLQTKIVDSSNIRKYYVIDTPSNKAVLDAFKVYRWATDGKGDVIEGKPYHGDDGTSDIMDSIRYPAQNLFIKGAKSVFTRTGEDLNKPVKNTIEANKKMVQTMNEKAMKNKIGSLATNDGISTVKKKGKIFWG
jgi:hypothetical protein